MSGHGSIFKDDPWATPERPAADAPGAQGESPRGEQQQYVSVSGPSSIFKDDPWATPQPPAAGAQALSLPSGAAHGPLVVKYSPPPAVATEVAANRLPLALLAGAATALVGGLVWAGVVVVTHYDIGPLAVLIGAATGIVIASIAGDAARPGARVAAAVLAAGAIIVGKYVIWVHAVRKDLGPLLAATGHPVHYTDTGQMGFFIHNVGSIVKPIYILWIAIAIVAAVRTSGGGALFGRRR
jgi:hypothetical protein